MTYLTSSEVCEMIRVGKSTLYHWVEEGKVPHYKRPVDGKLLFKEEEIIDWIEGRSNVVDRSMMKRRAG
ncbi:helix-turn-helix domain-containing protein [candidate division KSB3 bacterium]|nr:helix-turn-helix domain-containing protein [candidate division KSB3 bacterium]